MLRTGFLRHGLVARRALWICAIVLAVSRCASAQDEASTYSCENLEAVPAAERCSFIKAECPPDSRIPYNAWYYCAVSPHGVFVKSLFVLALLLVLPLLFCLLGDTADMYFSPTMALISQTIPKMRPRFAGVTFVAMGNGAPDLSANISAIRNGQIQLSAGAFTGAAMFVQCIVASEVIRISGGVRCQGATLRDLVSYTACISAVALAFHSGHVTRWFVAGTALAYAAYATWVFLGDEWHSRGRPALQPALHWMDLRSLLRRRAAPQPDPSGIEAEYTATLLPWAEVDESEFDPETPQPPSSSIEQGGDSSRAGGRAAWGQQPAGGPPARGSREMPLGLGNSGQGRLLGARSYQEAVWADLAFDPPDVIRQQLTRGGSAGQAAGGAGYAAPRLVSSSSAQQPAGSEGRAGDAVQRVVALGPVLPRLVTPFSGASEPQGLGQQPAGHDREREGRQEDVEAAAAAAAGAADGQGSMGSRSQTGPGKGGATPPHLLLEASEGEQQPLLAGRPPAVRRWREWYTTVLLKELSIGRSSEWKELPSWQRAARFISFQLLLPVYALLRFTIPLVDPETYSPVWSLATMTGSPLAVLAYFGVWSREAVSVSIVVGLVLSLLFQLLTRNEEQLPPLDFGTGFAFGPAVLSLMGFFMGVLWIDSLASEVVGIVSLLSNLAALPPSFVGLTLLAWGNSLGDTFGNCAMARRGLSSTALTACFAGPLFNMLLSLALGFSAHFAKEGVSRAAVVLTPDLILGCVCLVGYNLVVAAVGLLNKNMLPKRFYLFARSWYALYLAAAAYMGLREWVAA